MNMNKGLIGVVGAGIIGVGILGGMTAGMNEIGERVVIRPIFGTEQRVVFESGLYFKWGGKATVWPDTIDADFDKDANPSGAMIDVAGVDVQYADGGNGKVFGNGTFQLPSTREEMLAIQSKYKSPRGLAYKLIKPTVEETLNLTAGLMTSEDAYNTKRAIYGTMVKAQLAKGTIKTQSVERLVEDPATGKKTFKTFAEPIEKDGKYVYIEGGFQEYGITPLSFQLQKPTFEPKTIAQIDKKREANMSIITAKANAEKAKQDTITIEQQGIANAKKAEYEELEKKTRAIVKAEQAKEVARIAAEQKVEVARQGKLEAEQKKLTAIEYKQEQIYIGEGDAERKRLVMEADGALEQKLSAYVEVQKAYAAEFGKQKWVPEVQMGSVSGDNGSSAMSLIEMLSVKAAKDLSIDMGVK